MEFWRHTARGVSPRLWARLACEQDVHPHCRLEPDGPGCDGYVAQEAPETMAFLEAYSAGVNAYLAEQGDDVSLNRRILALSGEPWEIEPWEPLDSIGWSIVMSWDLGGNWSDERDRAALIREVGEATAASILPPYPFEERPVIAPTDLLSNRSELELEPAGEGSRLLPEGVD